MSGKMRKKKDLEVELCADNWSYAFDYMRSEFQQATSLKPNSENTFQMISSHR